MRFALPALAVVALAAPAFAWQGARLLHLEPAPARAVGVQTPILDWQPTAPTIDDGGRVWLIGREGDVRLLVPWLGVRGQWQVDGGLENSGVPTVDGAGRLFVTRDGRLLRIDAESPTPVSLGTGGLATAVDRPCRAGALHVWPDAEGGITVLDDQAQVVERLEGDVYRTRQVRGGAVAVCEKNRAVVGLAGGKLVGLEDGRPVWTAEPAGFDGEDWAPRAATIGDRVWLCGRERGCLIIDGEGQEVGRPDSAGSLEGPVALDGGRVAILGRDGRLAVFAQDGAALGVVDVGLTPQRLLAPTAAADSTNTLWSTGTDGGLRRIDLESGRVQVLYRAPGGFFAGGAQMHDGHAVLISNHGAVFHFQLR